MHEVSMGVFYQLIKDYVPAGLLLECWQTRLLPDVREFTFVINDKPQQYTTKLYHFKRSPGWTKYSQSTLALISDIDEASFK